MRTHISKRNKAFTAVEMLAVVGLLVLLGLALLPNLANKGRRSTRIQCVSNLKQVGLAFIVWAHDNEKNNLSFRVPSSDGGTMVPTGPFRPGDAPAWNGQQNNLWFQYAWVSNLLGSPKVFVCPSDKQKRPAANWGDAKHGGFRHASFQDKAVSYNLWPDAGVTGGSFSYECGPEQILISDRHLNSDNPSTACSWGNNSLPTVFTNTMTVGWQTQKEFGHGTNGGLALLDGSVASVGTPGARELFKRSNDNGTLHYLSPQ